jgi:hypothetical protein
MVFFLDSYGCFSIVFAWNSGFLSDYFGWVLVAKKIKDTVPEGFESGIYYGYKSLKRRFKNGDKRHNKE